MRAYLTWVAGDENGAGSVPEKTAALWFHNARQPKDAAVERALMTPRHKQVWQANISVIRAEDVGDPHPVIRTYVVRFGRTVKSVEKAASA